MNKEIKKLIILGTAGDGIRFLARKLINILFAKDNNLNITYYFDYDSTVRGGKTSAYIYVDKNKEPKSFIFNNCDLILSLRDNDKFNIKNREIIKGIGKKTFQTLSQENFGSKLYTNMIALGYLSAKLKLSDLAKLSQRVNLGNINKEAFKLGFRLYK